MTRSGLPRRYVLKLMGAAPVATPAMAAPPAIFFLQDGGPASAMAAGRGARKLDAALKAHGVNLNMISDIRMAQGLVIIAAMPESPLARSFPPPRAGWAAPDAVRLVPGTVEGHAALLVCATDTRGFAYGLYELAE